MRQSFEVFKKQHQHPEQPRTAWWFLSETASVPALHKTTPRRCRKPRLQRALSQAKKAVSERTGGTLDDPDQLAALAVAVASSEEPLATLETLCQSVLDGVDVGAALKALLDQGKKNDGKGYDTWFGIEGGSRVPLWDISWLDCGDPQLSHHGLHALCALCLCDRGGLVVKEQSGREDQGGPQGI